MTSQSNSRRRKTLRLKSFDYSQAGAYFVTICSYRKKVLFGEINNDEFVINECGLILESIWRSLPIRFPRIQLDSFVIMPNHIHGIIIIQSVGAIHRSCREHRRYASARRHELPLQKAKEVDSELRRIQRRGMLLPRVIGYYKMNTAKRINQFPETVGEPVWQRNYFEHVIRDGKSLERIRTYILDNPCHWEEDPENPALRGKQA